MHIACFVLLKSEPLPIFQNVFSSLITHLPAIRVCDSEPAAIVIRTCSSEVHFPPFGLPRLPGIVSLAIASLTMIRHTKFRVWQISITRWVLSQSAVLYWIRSLPILLFSQTITNEHWERPHYFGRSFNLWKLHENDWWLGPEAEGAVFILRSLSSSSTFFAILRN